MIQAGIYHTLPVLRIVAIGAYLDDGGEGILLPNRFLPQGLKVGDRLRVFIYHDGEERLIATTEKPRGVAGGIVRLRVLNVTPQGAFLDNGLMKDLFVPRSRQLSGMRLHGEYLVKLYVDEQTGRLAATQKFEAELDNRTLTVKEFDSVDLTAYRKTDIGWLCIINSRHTGVLHFNEVFRPLSVGDRFAGFIKAIHPPVAENGPGEYRIDVVAGNRGYQRVETESEKVMRLLRAHGGVLPYHDKSSPEDIYDFFEMSKKTFKMAVGKLFRERLILLQPDGIRLAVPESTQPAVKKRERQPASQFRMPGRKR
jgi:predicted RNA-binding protein (virulence factor B family)